jgi:hypothetical protein
MNEVEKPARLKCLAGFFVGNRRKAEFSAESAPQFKNLTTNAD